MGLALTDIPNSNLYVPGVINIDSRGNEVIHGVTPEFEIAQTGFYRGKRANLGYCLGRRSLGWVNTTEQGDVSNYLDTTQSRNTAVIVGTTYYLRSTSANDTVGGTGIRSMRVNYLNGAGVRTIANFNMNGTTAVSIGNDVSFVQYIESNTEGALGVAAGDITVSTVTGAPTAAQTIEKITAGDSRSLSGRVKVPSNFSMYLRGWFSSAISNTMDCRIRGTVFTDDRSLSSGFHFQQSAYLASGQNIDFPFEYLKFPPGAEVKVSAVPGGAPAGNRCDTNFHFLFIEN
jgi:hypothetical protein